MFHLKKQCALWTIIAIFCFLAISCTDPFTKDERNINKALNSRKFEKAEKILTKMGDRMRDFAFPSQKQQYWTSYFNVLNAEINYLIDDNDDNTVSVDRLVGLIQNRTTGLLPPYIGITNDKKVIKTNEKYNEISSRTNALLDNAISRAISKRDRYLATSILKCYKPLLIKDYAGGGLFEASSYSFSYSYDAQYAAEAIVNAAIKKGQL